MSANKNKLKQLVLYIIQTYNNEKLTETKLQKLLYFCDFSHFEKFGSSITGFEYKKNHFGPTIVSLPAILQELETEGIIKKISSSNYYGSRKTNFLVEKIIEKNVEENFTASELLVINEINEAYFKLTPSEISRLSHTDSPYLATKELNQVIEYNYVSYRSDANEEADQADVEAQQFFSSDSFSQTISKLKQKLSAKSYACN